MKTRSTLFAVLLCLLAFAAQAQASVIAVIQGPNGFKVAITDAATVAWAECHGDRLVCSSGFHLCTDTQDFGSLGDVPLGLQRALVSDAFKHGQPFTTALANGNGAATYLVPVGIDPETGAPLYTAPTGKSTFLVLNQKPAAGFCVGVESFFEIRADEGCWCIKRKAYNACAFPVTLLTEKELYLICSPGIFTVNQHVAQAQITIGPDIAHVFLEALPGLSQSKLTAGSVAAGSDFTTEFTTCSPTAGLSTGQEVGTRWLELLVDLRPGGSTLAKAGQPGFERFFGHCICLQCNGIPPGSGCTPTVICIPDPPPPGSGDPTCPLSHGYWKNHSSAWPVSTMALGSKSYTKTELLALLAAPVVGDASKILAKQLIAAKLNIANGSPPAPVLAVIALADTLLASYTGKLPYGVAPSSAAGQAMTTYAGILESYNTRKLSPGCAPE